MDGGHATVADLLERVSGLFPALSDAINQRSILISVNQEFVKPDHCLKDGDEVALMPPFSEIGRASCRERVFRSV